MTSNQSLLRLKGDLRNFVKDAAGPASHALGWNLLSKKRTQARLETQSVSASPGSWVRVLAVGERSVRRIDVLRSGLVRVNSRDVLDVDYGNRSAFHITRLATGTVDRALVLWSHLWTGYYHWVIDLLPKICLFQAEYGTSLGGRFLCYPSFGQQFEKEFLRLLGVPQEQVIDTRHYRRIGVKKDLALVPVMGWNKIHPAVGLVRDRLMNVATRSGANRIYVSRRGRRKVTNEDQVIAALAPYGFELVEDVRRPVEEQIGLFKYASVVVAPHGAALANLLWSAPGTLLIELLPATYPPAPKSHYQTLCSILGLRYRAVTQWTGKAESRHWTAMHDDITVDITSLRQVLDENLEW